MRRWRNSVIRIRMPGWYFRIGSVYYHQKMKRTIRKLNRMHEDHRPIR